MARFYRPDNAGKCTLRQNLDSRYSSSRTSLLIVILFTVINIVLLLLESDTYFLFAAFIPYYLVTLGMLMCGKFPAEYYTEELAGIEFVDSSFLAVTLIMAAVILILYFLGWLISKKHKVGWLIFSLVLFSLDTLSMLAMSGLVIDMLIDIVFHGWVIFELARGIYAHYKWVNAPLEAGDEGFVGQENAEGCSDDFTAPENSDTRIIRAADRDVKHRVLLECEAFGHQICYRRVKKVNELVIDGYVYDEFVAVIEFSHELFAYVDGHAFAVGYNGANSYCKVDGAIIAKKMRWY